MVLKSAQLLANKYFPRAIIAEGVVPGMKVLDIGCAEGDFLNLCDQYGLRTYGIDLNQKFLKTASTKTNARLAAINLNQNTIPFGKEKFDLITVFDVIEHLDSPLLFLTQCAGRLNQGGKLIITTPNIDSLGRLVMAARWHGYSDLTHKYLFSPHSLGFVMSKTGLSEVRISAPFHPFPKFIDDAVAPLLLGGQVWNVGTK